MTQRYLEVALPVPLRSAFTYAAPNSFNGEELVGRRVLVPFRNRPMVGVGLAVTEQAPETKRIKEIAELLDPFPALPPKLIELGHWISRYYLAPIGETFRAMLPPEIELRHDREYWLTDAGRAYLAELAQREEKTDVEKAELEFLQVFDAEAPGANAGRTVPCVRHASGAWRAARPSPKNLCAEVISPRAKSHAVAKRVCRKSSRGAPTPPASRSANQNGKFAKF